MSLRIPYDTIKETVKKAFLNVGLSEEQAEVCATIHTQSSADGVESHGLNRIPRFVEYVPVLCGPCHGTGQGTRHRLRGP